MRRLDDYAHFKFIEDHLKQVTVELEKVMIHSLNFVLKAQQKMRFKDALEAGQ